MDMVFAVFLAAGLGLGSGHALLAAALSGHGCDLWLGTEKIDQQDR